MSTNNSNNQPLKLEFSVDELSLLDSLETTDDDQGEETEEEENILTSIDEMLECFDPDSDSVEQESVEESEDQENKEIKNDTNWFVVASELRQKNQELMAKVTKLERALKESEASQASYHNHLINQQAEQVNHLLENLEAAHTTIQRQKILNETVSQQLAATQEQFAQIERECALLQDQYNEQTYKLQETEKQAQELQYRLNREQRNALQYKAALEKSVEISTYTSSKPKNIVTAAEIPKMQPIKPWSKNIDDQNNTPKNITTVTEPNTEGNIEAAQDKPVKSVQSNWPSPTISLPDTTQKTPPTKKSIELPTFLK